MRTTFIPKKIGTCEICGEDVLEGQGNVMMMGFNGSHCVHIIHREDDYSAYCEWRDNILSYRHNL
jgi:hypothetical protein